MKRRTRTEFALEPDAERMVAKEQIDEIFTILSKHIRKPKSELDFDSNFQLLVAVILSAQSTDVAVNGVTARLFRVAPTPRKMLRLGEEKLKSYIRSLGLFNNKAKNLMRTAKLLVEEYGSAVPNDRAALERLPGVGRKSAGVVLNVAFGENTIPVDTHVFRVANRTGLANAKTAVKTERQLMQTVPAWVGKDAHHLLILHGRYTCKARKPLCRSCPIVRLCLHAERHPEFS